MRCGQHVSVSATKAKKGKRKVFGALAWVVMSSHEERESRRKAGPLCASAIFIIARSPVCVCVCV